MNNILNSKLLEFLSGVDKNKLEQVSNMVKNMSRDDIQNLVTTLGLNNSQEPKQTDEPNK